MATSRRRRRAVAEVEGQAGVIHVVRKLFSDGEVVDHEDAEEIEVQEFQTDPAYVTVKAGLTKQIRDYESLRVDVSLSVPCYLEDVPATFDAVAEIVAMRLQSEVDNYMGVEGGETEEE